MDPLRARRGGCIGRGGGGGHITDGSGYCNGDI